MQAVPKAKWNTQDLVLRSLSLRPGAQVAQLVALVGRSEGAVTHALQVLGRKGEVQRRRTGASFGYFRQEDPAGSGYLVHGSRLRVLCAINEFEGASLPQIAAHLEISRSEASRLCANLERNGLLVRVWRGSTLHYLACSPL